MAPPVVEDIYPLSPLQEGLLFHALSGASGLYFEQLRCTVAGPLDRAAFERTWHRLIERHAVLRTAFDWEDAGAPVQVVLRQVELPIAYHDWRGLSRARLDEQYAGLLAADLQKGFVLDEPPLMRLALVRTADEEHRLLWSFHHLVLDGWSSPLLLDEAFAIYDALRSGGEPRLPPVRPYRDYIAWLKGQDLERARVFWQERLAGLTRPARLQTDGHRAAGPASAAESRTLRLDGERTARLNAFARRHQLTLNTLVQAAWARLLSHYSGSEDVVFGVTVSGRPPQLRGVETMVGLFINSLPLRLRVAPDEPLLEWLQRLRRLQVDLQPFEHTPLAAVQRWSEVPPGEALFETLLAFENYPLGEGERPGRLIIRDVETGEQTNYPLTLAAIPGAELVLQLRHDPGRFGRPTAQRLLDQLEVILTGLLQPGALRIADVPLLGEAERHQVTVEWNDTAAGAPRERLLHHIFERQAERTPAAVAAEIRDERLSYAELDAQANQLAWHLSSLGLGPDDLVAISVERSLALPLSILGVLKAGAAYLPLDPDYPEERLAFMLRDARPRLLITQEGPRGRMPADLLGTEVIFLDRDHPRIARHPATAPAVAVDGENLCYVIYTSGSTGRPKGALVCHRGACNLAEAQLALFQLPPGGRHLQFSSLNFDASIFEILLAWRAGGTLVLSAADEALPGPGLIRLLQDRRIHQVTLPPSALAASAGAELPDLHSVIAVGEACPRELVEAWAPGRRFWNAYGPTEITVWATASRCLPGGARPAIGRPAENTRVHLVDCALQPQPIGVPGELVIGGHGVSRGYLRRPELTAERFIPDPFSAAPGGRLYRSGDLAAYRADGEIDFLGRLDHQVKIRGFRIELGEIETALAEDPAIREAVVVSREEHPGEKRLVAYLVTRPGAEAPTVTHLRAVLKQRLPDYMVPAAFVVLDELPLTPNRKVDRRALPAPENLRPDLEQAFVEPLPGLEHDLAAIWAEVLKVERVGREDNFFELGGDSILSIQVVARARDLGLQIPPQEIFQNPTIARLAAHTQRATAVPSAPEPAARFALAGLDEGQLQRLVGDRPDAEDLYPLAPMQQGMLFHAIYSPDSSLYFHQLICTLVGKIDIPAFERAWEGVLDRHPVLRTAFLWEGLAEPLQRVDKKVALPLAMLDWRDAPPAEREERMRRFLAADRERGFDVGVPPLMRLSLIRLADEAARLIWSFHHVLLDGWSSPVLLREVFAVYEGVLRSEQPRLAPVRPYRDYLAWLKRQDPGEAEIFWRRQLGGFARATPLGIAAPAALPGDPSGETGPGEARALLAIDADRTRSLRALLRQHHLTLGTLAQGLWGLLLSRYSGAQDVLFGTTVSGRPADLPGAETMVGLFINTLPLRLTVSPSEPLLPWLQRLQDQLAAMRRFEFMPLNTVQGWSDVPRGEPLFESLLVFENIPAEGDLGGASTGPEIRDVEIEGGTHYPFTLVVLPLAKLTFEIRHDPARFDGAAVRRLLIHVEALLRGICEDPDRTLGELPLMTEAEKKTALAAVQRKSRLPAHLQGLLKKAAESSEKGTRP